MNVQRHLLLMVTFAAAVTAASGQQVVPTPANVGVQTPASIPDFSGIWRHGNLPWFIPPASGPGPVTNLSRTKDSGVSDYSSLVGDYKNPILQAWAADVRSEEHTSELQSLRHLVCRLLLAKKKQRAAGHAATRPPPANYPHKIYGRSGQLDAASAPAGRTPGA